MFEKFLVRSDSLRNEKEGNEVIGFSIAVRHANYRGVFLSLHNGYYLSIDGIEYPTRCQKFEINGEPPRSFEEIYAAVNEHWDYDDEAILHIYKPGGLKSGEHVIKFQQSVLAGYGYRPTDEEWVKNPPIPGSGAGSDKAPEIETYMLNLTEEGDKS